MTIIARWLGITIDTIDPPVPLAAYRAKCDEVTRLEARVRVLEGQLAAMEQGR
jgi:hypothetical protein